MNVCSIVGLRSAVCIGSSQDALALSVQPPESGGVFMYPKGQPEHAEHPWIHVQLHAAHYEAKWRVLTAQSAITQAAVGREAAVTQARLVEFEGVPR